MNLRAPLLFSLAATLIACDADAPTNPDDSRVVARFALSPSAQPVGVTVDPATGQRFILDAEAGIDRLAPDGTLLNVWRPHLDRGIAVNDLCAVSDSLFMVVGGGDGYLLDLNGNRTLDQHFCLEPGFMDDWGDRDPDTGEPTPPATGDAVSFQQSYALSCDVSANRIYAQPRTDMWDETGFFDVVRSDVASYDLETGADLDWRPLSDATTNARGMYVSGQGVVWLGEGSRVVAVGDDGNKTTVVDLAPLGVTNIDGMTLDTRTGTLLVLDSVSRELLEVEL